MFQSLEYKHPKFYQVFRLFIVFFASLLYAWNLRCFAKTAGLFPGGFSGLSLLLQQIGLDFIHVSIPFSVFNIGLNLVPTYIAYKFRLNHKFCGISDSSRSSVGSYRIASERNIRHQDIRIPVCEES